MELSDLANQIAALHGDLKEHCAKDDLRYDKIRSTLFGNGKEGWDTKLYRHERELGALKKVTWGVVMGVIGSLVWLARTAIAS